MSRTFVTEICEDVRKARRETSKDIKEVLCSSYTQNSRGKDIGKAMLSQSTLTRPHIFDLERFDACIPGSWQLCQELGNSEKMRMIQLSCSKSPWSRSGPLGRPGRLGRSGALGRPGLPGPIRSTWLLRAAWADRVHTAQSCLGRSGPLGRKALPEPIRSTWPPKLPAPIRSSTWPPRAAYADQVHLADPVHLAVQDCLASSYLRQLG